MFTTRLLARRPFYTDGRYVPTEGLAPKGGGRTDRKPKTRRRLRVGNPVRLLHPRNGYDRLQFAQFAKYARKGTYATGRVEFG